MIFWYPSEPNKEKLLLNLQVTYAIFVEAKSANC